MPGFGQRYMELFTPWKTGVAVTKAMVEDFPERRRFIVELSTGTYTVPSSVCETLADVTAASAAVVYPYPER